MGMLKKIIFAAALVCLFPCPVAQSGQAACRDVYQIYQECHKGGQAVGMDGCRHLIEALGPRLLGEGDVSGFSAALSTAICKAGCEDGAQGKGMMPFPAFRKEFCGESLK